MTIELKTIKPVLVAEISESEPGKVLVPATAIDAGVSIYRTILIPAGETAWMAIGVGAKELARESWVADPKAGFNAALQVGARVFDCVEADTFKVVVEEPL